ncbi:glycosyltransferase family 2 protein [Anabaena sp. UHCC 0399]|uniref:glycosyltransferase family 2 protein n=1 Tax=Anabaena sp. UHCC 0399 TaxID=3110238 RepID=UPI001686D42D|nr:glycosyltransferase [Anabaena sp. UHCC 0399]MBD2359721.1 glycosyltransferase [Anabaena minutissima FACHB-250]MEA5568529.1 glycosyltransferase [Anabaena sp. UHCC 0399]
MRVSVCITTRNRPQYLENCLRSLWDSDTKPHSVVVSDDSPDLEVQERNYQIVQQYPHITYLTGPRIGVCANRNNAVNAILSSETDFVAFIDDDICVEPDFITRAIAQYTEISPEQRNSTILSGISHSPEGCVMASGKLSFRGYFCASDIPETVAIHATIFPRQFFDQEQWDENIFFGYEDAELCLRALKREYKILHCPELRVLNTGDNGKSSLMVSDIGTLTYYEISIEAARLYVGIKRYKNLFPNLLKLAVFCFVYFLHMTVYLWRRSSLQAWPEIIRRSHVERLWQSSQLKWG